MSNRADDAGATRPVPARRSFALAVACAASLLAIVAVWLLGHIGGSFVTRAFTDVVEMLVALGAAILCWRASRARSGRDRLGWMLLGGAALSWSAGQASSSVADLQPDKGDQSVLSSNLATLGKGRQDLHTAWNDLQGARHDARSAIDDLKDLHKS